MKYVAKIGLAIALASLLIAIQPSGMAQDKKDEEKTKPKHTIKEVMKKAHKDKLLNKVLDGSATDKQKIELMDLYVSMAEGKPPKGDKESWVKLAHGSVFAAAKVVAGREGAVAELKKATNCGACHKAHKGK